MLILQILVLKHFIVDFLLQTPYMYLNKGNYKHLGGYAHAGLHGLVTFLLLAPFVTNTPLLLLLSVVEVVLHYVIDWGKVNINKTTGWKADTHNQFWILLGVDQFLHYQTYIFMWYLLEVNNGIF